MDNKKGIIPFFSLNIFFIILNTLWKKQKIYYNDTRVENNYARFNKRFNRTTSRFSY